MVYLLYLFIILLVAGLFIAVLAQPIVALIECASSSSLSFTKKFFWLLVLIIIWGPASWVWGVLHGGRISKLFSWTCMIMMGIFAAIYLTVDEKMLSDMQQVVPSIQPSTIPSGAQPEDTNRAALRPPPLTNKSRRDDAKASTAQQGVESIKAFNASARSFHDMLETHLPELQNVIASVDITLKHMRERTPNHPALAPCDRTVERLRDSATNIAETKKLIASLAPVANECERHVSPQCARVTKAAVELEELLAKQSTINADALTIQAECRAKLLRQS